jgi:hypothetical protein
MVVSIHDQITQLIDQAAEEKSNAKINKFLGYVSVTYEIELSVLLRNYQNISQLEVTPSTSGRDVPNQCIGFNKAGNRCKFKGKYNGCCHHHKDSYRVPPPPPVVKDEVYKEVHDHPGLYYKNCPACKKMKTNSSSSEKLLIEL